MNRFETCEQSAPIEKRAEGFLAVLHHVSDVHWLLRETVRGTTTTHLLNSLETNRWLKAEPMPWHRIEREASARVEAAIAVARIMRRRGSKRSDVIRPYDLAEHGSAVFYEAIGYVTEIIVRRGSASQREVRDALVDARRLVREMEACAEAELAKAIEGVRDMGAVDELA